MQHTVSALMLNQDFVNLFLFFIHACSESDAPQIKSSELVTAITISLASDNVTQLAVLSWRKW